MASLRVVSGMVELLAAWLMWRTSRPDHALQVNAALGLFGPTVFLLVTLVGIAGLAGRLAPGKLVLVVLGALLMFLGTRRG